MEVTSFLQPCGFWVSNSDRQDGLQEPCSLSHLAGVTTLRLAKSVTQKIQLWVGILNPCVN